MKIAIISDIHNNTTNLGKVIDFCQKNLIGTIICCGDLASLETLDLLNEKFIGRTYYVLGNMDNDFLKGTFNSKNQYGKTLVFPEVGTVEIERSKIAFTHFPKIAEELAHSGNFDLVFYGHTHKPWSDVIEIPDGRGRKCMMINPGNVAGEIYPPTFAIWDSVSKKFELLRINPNM